MNVRDLLLIIIVIVIYTLFLLRYRVIHKSQLKKDQKTITKELTGKAKNAIEEVKTNNYYKKQGRR